MKLIFLLYKPNISFFFIIDNIMSEDPSNQKSFHQEKDEYLGITTPANQIQQNQGRSRGNRGNRGNRQDNGRGNQRRNYQADKNDDWDAPDRQQDQKEQNHQQEAQKQQSNNHQQQNNEIQNNSETKQVQVNKDDNWDNDNQVKKEQQPKRRNRGQRNQQSTQNKVDLYSETPAGQNEKKVEDKIEDSWTQQVLQVKEQGRGRNRDQGQKQQKQIQKDKKVDESNWGQQLQNMGSKQPGTRGNRGNDRQQNNEQGGRRGNREGRGNRNQNEGQNNGGDQFNKYNRGGRDRNYGENRERDGRDGRDGRDRDGRDNRGRGGFRGGYRGDRGDQGNRQEGGYRGNRQEGGYRGNREGGNRQEGGYRGNRQGRGNRDEGGFRGNRQYGDNRGNRQDRGNRGQHRRNNEQSNTNGAEKSANVSNTQKKAVQLTIKPKGLKCWPQLSIYIKQAKLSFTYRQITEHYCDILVFPFIDYKFLVYPSDLINKFNVDHRARIKQKVDADTTGKSGKQGWTYMKQCQDMENFKAIVFLKISADPTVNPNLIERVLKAASSLAQTQPEKLKNKKYSILIPYSNQLGNFSDCLDAVAKKMGDVQNLKQVIFSTNNASECQNVIEKFSVYMKDLVKDNMIAI